MKRLYTCAVVFIIAATVVGCCDKSDCDRGPDRIQLESFEPGEGTTLIVEIYEASSGFTTRLNKTIYTDPDTSGILAKPIFYLHEKLLASRNYKITVPGTGAEYYISDFTSEQVVCNKCVFKPDGDHYERLLSYSLNGKPNNPAPRDSHTFFIIK